MASRYTGFVLAAACALWLGAGAPAFAQAASDGPALVEAGEKALAESNYDDAVKHFSRAIRSDSLSSAQIAKALYRRGVAQRAAGRHAQAIADITGALYLKGLSKEEQANARLNRGMAYQSVGLSDLANSEFQQARQLDPGARPGAAGGPKVSGVPAFSTSVETAEASRSSGGFFSRLRGTGQRAQPERTAAAEARPAATAAAEPRPSISAFETRISEAAPAERPEPKKPRNNEPPKPVPEFRTSIQPQETAPPPPASQPTASAPQAQPQPSQWDVSVAGSGGASAQASQETADAAKEESGGSRLGRLFSGVFDRGSKNDKKEEGPPPGTAPLARADWGQSTKVEQPDQAAAAAPGKGYRIQLASVRSESEAQTTWKQLTSRHEALLDGREPVIEKTDLGSLGTFYRIQIGPFADKRESLQLCNSFKRSGVDCFLVAQ